MLLEQQRRDDVQRAGGAVEHLQRGTAAVGQPDPEHALGADLAHHPRMRAHQLGVERAVERDELGVRAHRRAEPLSGRAEVAGGEPPERRREPRDRHRERAHPAAVGGAGELARRDPRRLGETALHRVLERVPLVDVALGRPALSGREGEPERVLARAVVAHRGRVVAGLAQRDRRRRVARLGRPAGEVGLRAAGGGEDLAHGLDVEVAAAVRRAGQRKMLGGEAELLGHAGADARERLERLGRRARVDGRPGVGGRLCPAGAAGPAAAAAVGRRPRHTVLAFDAGSAAHAHQSLPDHDARTW